MRLSLSTCLFVPETRGCYVREERNTRRQALAVWGNSLYKSAADSRASNASAQITYDGHSSDA